CARSGDKLGDFDYW
nr:immunoglobulin heavy chain junction region [Mus musculus]